MLTDNEADKFVQKLKVPIGFEAVKCISGINPLLLSWLKLSHVSGRSAIQSFRRQYNSLVKNRLHKFVVENSPGLVSQHVIKEKDKFRGHHVLLIVNLYR